MKCQRNLFKKKKINTMSNKMAKIESKKQTKQTRRTEEESWIQRAFCMDARLEGSVAEWVKG